MNKEGMEGKQLGSFSYNMRQFTYFEELKLAFGANVNIARILDIDISVDKGKSEENWIVCENNTTELYS